ncbi:unnamed protein product [Polarella glacialis]|uniref:ubiquitinyl hydrolase 1 n=1 Tax=Polarella glacialis TaxID=89957 RepID=A0A813JDG2_POLGL|nr:unnamed protein product [Polarella glacialis]
MKPRISPLPGETRLCGRAYKLWLKQQGLEDLRPKPVEKPAVGLHNLKNMCFLNAMLQSLYHTALLRRNLSLACKSNRGKLVKDEWLASLLQIFDELDDARTSKMPIVPTRIASLIQSASTNGEFARGAQADAHEAFMLLISKLLSGCILEDCSMSFTDVEQLERSSLIGHIFGMDLGQSVRCKSCGDESQSTRAEYCLHVQVAPLKSAKGPDASVDSVSEPSSPQSPLSPLSPQPAPHPNDPVDITSLLSEFTKGEDIPEWKCEKCPGKGCTRRAYLALPPNVLMIHVGRQQRRRGLISKDVSFDAELDMSQHIGSSVPGNANQSERRFRYLLYAVVVHRPVGRGGHYVAYVRAVSTEVEGWNLMDDEDVKAVSWSDVQKEDPLLLVYEADFLLPPKVTDAEVRAELEQKQLEEVEEAEKARNEQLEEEARAKAEVEAKVKAEEDEVARKAEELTLTAGRLRAEETARRVAREEWAMLKFKADEEAREAAESLSPKTASIAKCRARKVDLEKSCFPSCRCTPVDADDDDG